MHAIARRALKRLISSPRSRWTGNRTGGVGEETSYEFKKIRLWRRRGDGSGPQNGAETVSQRRDDSAAQLAGLLVRQRALRRAERDAERERALAIADLLAAVLVEHAE